MLQKHDCSDLPQSMVYIGHEYGTMGFRNQTFNQSNLKQKFAAAVNNEVNIGIIDQNL